MAKKRNELHSKIAGTTFKNDDGTSRQEIIKRHARAPQQIFLKHEPKPKYPNAVAVYIKAKSGCNPFARNKLMQIGYLKDELATGLSEDVQNNLVVGRIEEVTGGKGAKKTLGVNIFLRVKES